MVKNVKVIPGEPCVSQHRLLVGCFVFKKASNVKAKCKKRLRVWKLKNKESQLKFQESLREANTELLGAQDVESKWELMKKAMLKATETVCGWTNGARRHKETWWWNEEVDRAIKLKRECYTNWQKSNSEDRDENCQIFKEQRRKTKRIIAKSKERARIEMANDLENRDKQNELFRIAKQMKKERRDVVETCCLRNEKGDVVVDPIEIRGIWKEYMEKLMNEENKYDKDILSEGPINKGEIKPITSI
jgi:hypothetical protein